MYLSDMDNRGKRQFPFSRGRYLRTLLFSLLIHTTWTHDVSRFNKLIGLTRLYLPTYLSLLSDKHTVKFFRKVKPR